MMNTHNRKTASQIKAASKRMIAFAGLMAAILIAPVFSTEAHARGNGGEGGGSGSGEGGNGGGYSLNYGNVPNVFTRGNDPNQGQRHGRLVQRQDKAGSCIGKRSDCLRP